LKKEFNILKKPYLPPRVEFEEIEADEREMLLAGSTHSGDADDYEEGSGSQTTPTIPGLPVVTPPAENNSLDIDFSMGDFVIND